MPTNKFDEIKQRVSESRKSTNSGWDKIVNKVSKARQEQAERSVDEQYIRKFFSDTESYLSRSDYALKNSTWNEAMDSNAKSKRNATANDLTKRANTISRYLAKNDPDSDIQSKINKYLDAINKTSADFDEVSKYYSNWQSQDEYDTAARQYGYSKKHEGKTATELQDIIDSMEDGEEKEWLKSYASTVDYDEKAAYNLEAAQKEIEELEKKKEDLFQKYRGILASNQSATTYLTGPNGSPQTSGNYIGKIEGEESDVIRQMKDLDDEINQKKQYLNLADRVQYGIKLSSVADPNSKNYDPEFNNYTGYVADVKYELGGKPYFDDETYAYINNPTVEDKRIGGGEISARDLLGWNETAMSKDSPYYTGLKAETIYDFMTSDEIAIYNYYYNKHGKDAAKEYIEYLSESLNARKAQKDFEKYYEGNKLLELGHSITAGLDQFGQGIANLRNGDDYIPTTYSQYLSSMVREDLADVDLKWYNFKEGEWDDANIFGSSLGQTLYDVGTTTANMAPSILASAAVSMINPALGAWTGSALMGASAAGNAYADAINRGLDKSQAATYGVAIGVSEALLEKALGGISKFGGTSTKITKAVSGIDNALLRWSLRFGGSFASEALEEGLQEILDPIFQNAIFGTDEDVNWSEVAYSALLGGLSAGVFEGNSIRKDIKKEQSLKTEYEGKTDALIQEGLESDIDTESFKLANDYQAKIESGKSLTGAEIRNLLAANQEQIAPKDLKKIQKAAEARLIELGQTKDVQKLAELATKYATGQKLSKADKAFLANNKNGNRVAQELIPENIMSGEYTSEWAEGIGTKQVNKLAYNIKNIIEQMANPAVYKPLSDRIGEDEKVSVSDNGKATISGTDEEISIDKKVEVVDFVKDKKTGKITDIIINANGKQVKASEIDFADEDQAYLFAAVKHIENITPGDATAIVRGYDPSSGISVGEYLNGIDEAYTYGYHRYTEADMKSGLFTTKLSDEKAKGAYELGKLARKSSVEAKDAAIKRMRTAVEAEAEKAVAEGKPAPEPKKMAITYNEGNGVVREFDNEAIERLPDNKRAGVEVARILHKLGLGTNFEFFESFKSKKLKVKDKKTGKLVPARVFINEAGVEEIAPAGVYMKSDGTIRVDLNAYNGRGLTLYALAHELTHFIQQWSPEKYEILAEYLVSTYYKTGITMHQRVLREQARLKEIRKKEISYNEAYHEVVANAMMKMFDDGKLVQRLTELKAKDKNLAMKLWEGFKEILNKLLGVYQSDPGVFNDTKDLMQMKEDFEVLQGMFAEALVESSENFHAYMTASESQTLTEAGIGFDVDTRSVYSLNFSTATNDTIQVGKKSFDAEAISKLVAKVTGRSITDARKWVNSETAIASIVMQNPEFLDFEADNRYDAIKKNSDYPQGTVDLSNLCPKREEFTTMFDMLQKKYPNKLFTAQDVADMRKILSENGITVACGACFVEDRRQLIGEIADTFINMWKEAAESGKPLQKTNAAGNKVELLVTKALAKQYGLTAGAKIMATDTYIPNQYDLTTYEGFKLLEKNHPTIAMAFNRYNNSRGQQSARLIEGRAEYKRQILGWSDAKVRSVNNNGGLRIFSFSDFEVVHLLDLVQVIIDCAAKGVKIQGYTKIPAFAKLVRGTGIKLNRSLIPKGDYGYHMENGKVVLDYDTTEGIDINDKNFMDESDNPNVGNIVIGINPTQIGAAMLDPFIDYIIPFHSNKAKEILRKLGTGAWWNYKESQHEKDIATGTSSKHNVNIYTEVISKYHPTNKVEFVEAFLKECKRQGKIPRYAEFLNVDANGDYVCREGYHKLLVDFKMFDADGNILPQGNITPSLDENFMKELLNAEIDKKQNYEFPQKVYDAIDKKFGKKNLDNPSTDNENKLTQNQLRGEVDGRDDSRRSREMPSDHAEVTKKGMDDGGRVSSSSEEGSPDGRGHSDYAGKIQTAAKWRDLDPTLRKMVKKVVNSQIRNSESSNLIYYYLVSLTEKSESEMTPYLYRKAVEQLTEKLYNSAMNDHPVIFENDWTFMGENTAKLRKEIIEAAQMDSSSGELYSSQETDADYMDAVNRGDIETAQRMVNQTAKSNKYDVEMFHETDADNIHIFDISRGDHGGTDYQTPYGIFTKTSAKNIGLGSKQMALFVKAHNTLRVENRDDVVNKIPGFAKYYDQIQAIDKKYDAISNRLEDEEFDALQEWLEEHPDVDMDEVFPLSYIAENKPADIDYPKYLEAHERYVQNRTEWIETYNAVAVKAKAYITDYLRSNGYDSMYFAIDGGSRGRQTDSLIVLDENQVKSADPITYDDDGNIIPLSQRFNSGNDDIRFSSQETDIDTSGMDENAKEIINKLKIRAMGSRYLKGEYASYSSERIERELAQSSATKLDYAKSYIAWVNPDEFLYATTTSYDGREQIEKEAGALDLERLRKQTQPIHLTVDFETGKIVGHEGRHRMTALRNAGVNKVAVIFDAWNDDRYNTKPVGMMRIGGQEFDRYHSGLDFYVHDMLPLSRRYADATRKLFSEVDGSLRFSTQETDNISNRDMLANAFETLAQNSEEYKMIQDYKNHIRLLNEYEEKLSKLNAEIREITFGTEGERDYKRLRELQAKAKETAGHINRHDKELLNLEASEPLRKVIQQERKKEAQKTREHIGEILQNKKARAEQTEYRHKIRRVIRDLNKILKNGNKKQNVKEDMKGFVSKALELADYLFQDHVSNDDLIRKGITVPMRGNEAQLVKETEEILNKLYDEADSLTDEEFTRLDAKRKRNLEKLRDLLTAQRNERLRTPVYKLFDDLVTEYASLKNSSQESVKAAYDPNVERFLRSYIGETDGETDSDRKTLLQNMRVADMTTDELWKLYNAYTMVLKSVRDANKLHVKGRTESIEQMVTQIVTDFGKRNIPDKKLAIVARNIANKIGWDYEKLHYALDRIGSNAFTELIMNLANSENIVMRDVIEAAEFRDQTVEKYGFNNWDVNKEIDKEFLDNTGKKFKLTLGQLMSLYAYSRRDGAWDHIEYGGFVFGEKALTNPKPADSYKLSKEQCMAITNTLTKEQKAYVEDMQKFLSETMGAKGNEVSMELYGIKMFGEKNYFPIHIAGQFKAQAQESQAKQAAGFGSMSNAGFTHAQNPNAKAPFVLEAFNDVWADHVNEMSRYHGTVPALEDIRRVMNRSSYSESTAESTSVKAMMENYFGSEAVDYFDNLYREANSGAITDKMQGKSKRFLSFFRKGSTAYSLSVWVQQPASIVRAYAMIDRKYFGTKGMGVITSGVVKAVSDKWTKAHTNAYNEMLKYAPGVTMAKDIGGFDTATGGSIRSYLLDTNKSFIQSMKTENLKGKGKALMNKVDDNAIANTPNLADKIAWIEIWNACKRETVAKHKDLATSSEEFMQLVGERFTEVIRATQVYDSIFAKSPMLKSKNLAVQYLVSFMNEPNTVANMAESAVRDLARGNVKQGLRKAHVLIHSIIFTSILKSMIYAMRDDDEDETYIEKYIESLTGSLMDDFNPFNYIPFARDVWSVAQGYDVERADMAIVSDAISALNNVIKNATKDTDGMTEDELVEFDKKATEASWDLVVALAGLVGIPAKNIRREINSVIDHAKIASANAGQTTAMSAWDKFSDAVIESIPFMSNDKTKNDKLYIAIVNGDTAYVDRIKDTYKTDNSYHNAVRKALRENDPRIKEAALAEISGNPSERVRIQKLIIADGFDQDDVVAATNSEIADLTPDEEDSGTDKKKGFYTTENFVREFVNGDTTSAKTAKSDIISTAITNGKTKEQAEKDFMSSVSSSAKKAYEDGWLTESKAKKLLVEYAGEDEEGAASKVNYWTLSKLYPKYKDLLNESRTEKYHECVKPAGISMDMYAQFLTKIKVLATKYDKNGKVVLSEKDQVKDVIHSLPLTRRQKNALYLAAGYAESGLDDVPW